MLVRSVGASQAARDFDAICLGEKCVSVYTCLCLDISVSMSQYVLHAISMPYVSVRPVSRYTCRYLCLDISVSMSQYMRLAISMPYVSVSTVSQYTFGVRYLCLDISVSR